MSMEAEDLNELAVRSKTCLEARAELAGATYERLQPVAQRRTHEATMAGPADFLHEYFVRRFEADVQRYKVCLGSWRTYSQNSFVYSIRDTLRMRNFNPVCNHVGRTTNNKPGREVRSFSTDRVLTEKGKPVTIGDSLADRRRDAAEELDRLCDLIRCCDGRERLVMLLLYVDGLTMESIGKQIGLSESRISQIHSGILNRIQQRLCSRRNAA